MKKPFDYETAKSMFVYIAYKLNENPCDNTSRYAIEWIYDYFGEDDKSITNAILFLEEHGGYCDCEILMNVNNEEYWK